MDACSIIPIEINSSPSSPRIEINSSLGSPSSARAVATWQSPRPIVKVQSPLAGSYKVRSGQGKSFHVRVEEKKAAFDASSKEEWAKLKAMKAGKFKKSPLAGSSMVRRAGLNKSFEERRAEKKEAMEASSRKQWALIEDIKKARSAYSGGHKVRCGGKSFDARLEKKRGEMEASFQKQAAKVQEMKVAGQKKSQLRGMHTVPRRKGDQQFDVRFEAKKAALDASSKQQWAKINKIKESWLVPAKSAPSLLQGKAKAKKEATPTSKATLAYDSNKVAHHFDEMTPVLNDLILTIAGFCCRQTADETSLSLGRRSECRKGTKVEGAIKN